eukprot:363060-Chlamydomonas_euryale.AAC.3
MLHIYGPHPFCPTGGKGPADANLWPAPPPPHHLLARPTCRRAERLSCPTNVCTADQESSRGGEGMGTRASSTRRLPSITYPCTVSTTQRLTGHHPCMSRAWRGVAYADDASVSGMWVR